MNTEQKILKLISENKGKPRAYTVAKHLKLGNSYVEYLCEQLLKKGLIKKLKDKGWYKITRKGREEIGEKIRPSKKMNKRKKITKKGKKKKYKRKAKQEKKRIRKQRPKKRKKIRKPKAKSRGRGQIFKKARKSEPKIEKEKKEQLESLTSQKTEAKEEKKGIIEVFKKLFAKPPEKAK